MGVNLKDLLEPKEIEIKELAGKTLAIDSYNILYQFLSTIRQQDGTLLLDSDGNITSHLVGLFNKASNLMLKDIKLVFVFDGEVPDLKLEERKRRKALKQEAEKLFEKAKARHDIISMKKYASRMSYLTKDMVDEAKELIRAMGMPVVQAPSEGEAQAAFMVGQGDAYAVVSQDYDSLLYKARVIRNLTVSGRRKKIGSIGFVTVKPEMLYFEETSKKLGLTQDQMIVLAILVGTDYNIGGVKGIGPKKAIKLVKEHGEDFDTLFKEIEFEKHCEHSWKTIFDTFKNMKTTNDYSLKWHAPDKKKVTEILLKHDFSKERIDNTLTKLCAEKQQTLGDF